MNEIFKKILIVEDSKIERDLLMAVFNNKGYQVRALEDTTGFMEQVESDLPDIILLDVLMPETNGNDLLSLIREKWNSIELPVIMITSKSEASDIVESLDRGANDYIKKPLEYSIALRRIKTHLEMAALSKKISEFNKIEAMRAMVTTYHHKIINPLSIAIGFLEMFHIKYPKEDSCLKIQQSLLRISEIMKKMGEVLASSSVELENYSDSSKMLKLKK